MTHEASRQRHGKSSLEREFAESTSLHGIAKVFHASRLLIRFVWVAIMLTCLCVCVWQISDRFHRFLQYKANTEISVEYTRDLDFPAVTICNFNRYRSSALTESDKTYLPYIIWANDYDYDSFGDSQGGVEYWDVVADDGRDNDTHFNYTDFTLRAGFLMDDITLRQCEWRRKTKSCSPANFSHVFTSFGNCWTFNSGKTGPILKETQAGSGNGVRMLIDIQQSEYTETVDGNIPAGLKVLIHDQATPPFVESSGLAISPGVYAFIGVRKQQYLNLEHPYGKCNASKTLTRFSHYTREGCKIECRARAILEKCNCRLVRHPGNETECSPQQTSGCAMSTLGALVGGEDNPCDCPVPCNYTTFTTSLSTASIPSNSVAAHLQGLTETSYSSDYSYSSFSVPYPAQLDLFEEGYIPKNVILLDVFYEDINFERYEQSEAITPSALISDIGGQLGLFLGASFITLAEILSYFGKKIDFWIQRGLGKHRRLLERQRDNRHGRDVPLKSVRIDNGNHRTLWADV
ncbi:acid-sensing ion channel 1C-like [Acanthaster planci]|uniref:Acid-sensing ion channel 1C-like n=1 Tax=Acanthaster planci TaxID=133434 RepID=A0A8B7Y0V9_ACAPL|nr:acid-sensing ion channel 1C-like [Acanthaster planci]XP_022086792.1 acid-sensing ion channel 1C-like [Acanthaster planci]XP_022086793.1 acid-sensing ion channel 1C-like [Acanthaster planci]XP_022086794.1 acid-sensing ion channel 1C-like [Acanthaster planci]